MSVMRPERLCDLRGCSETYDRDERGFWEVKRPDGSAFGSRYCSVNCAKIALMREEREESNGE